MPAVNFPFKVSGEKDVENAFNSIARAAEKYKKASETASQAAAKAAQAATAAIKHASEEQSKANDKAAEKATKASEKASQASIKASDRETEHKIRNFEKQTAAAEKAATKRAQLIEKTLVKETAAAKKIAERDYQQSSSKNDKFMSALGGAALGGAAVLAGVIGSAARESVKLDEIANRLSIAGRGYGQTAVSPTDLRKSFEATAIATPGVKSEEVAAGVSAFVSRTGRLDIAQQMQGTWATAASASGSDMKDIGSAAADLMEKFDIKTIDDMRTSMALLISQGKEGAFELKDAAGEYGKIASAASRFDIGKGTIAVATLGGLTQMARRSTGSAEEAGTAVSQMFSHLLQNAGTLKTKGINVFNKDGTSRGIQDILADTISKTGGNDMAKKSTALQQIFGERGISAVSPLITTYKQAFQTSKTGGASDTQAAADAMTALRAELEKNINVASSWSEVQKDSAQAQQTASAQLDVAWEKVKAAVGEKVTPALIALAPKVAELVPALVLVIDALGTMVDWMKTIPALAALFEDKEAKKKEQELEDKTLQDKIDARAASPEHLAFDPDEDPVLNDLINQQYKTEQDRAVRSKLLKEEADKPMMLQLEEEMQRSTNIIKRDLGFGGGEEDGQIAYKKGTAKADEADNAELAKNTAEAAKNMGVLAEVLGSLNKDHPHSAKW